MFQKQNMFENKKMESDFKQLTPRQARQAKKTQVDMENSLMLHTRGSIVVSAEAM